MMNVLSLFGINRQDFFVIKQLAHRDKSRENASSFLGQVWQILNPFINMMVLVLVFSTMFANKKFVNFPLYVATGTIFFDVFSSGTKSCLKALVANKNFLIKTQLDKEIYIKEKVYVVLINFTYSFLIYLGIMAFYHVPVKLTMILLIPDLVLLILLVYGLGMILSVINVLFADISYLYDIFVLMLFYGSALFFDPAKLGIEMQTFLSFNPIYLAIAIARISILDGKIPGIGLWIKLMMYALFFYFIGKRIFVNSIENIVAKI